MTYKEAIILIRSGQKVAKLLDRDIQYPFNFKPKLRRKGIDVGYGIHFTLRKGACHHGGYFPDKFNGDSWLADQGEAQRLAKMLAEIAPREISNIYIIDADFKPINTERFL